MSDAGAAKRIKVAKRSPAYWRVTFDMPPLKIFGPDALPDSWDRWCFDNGWRKVANTALTFINEQTSGEDDRSSITREA